MPIKVTKSTTLPAGRSMEMVVCRFRINSWNVRLFQVLLGTFFSRPHVEKL